MGLDMNDWERRSAQAWARIEDYLGPGRGRGGRIPGADRRTGRRAAAGQPAGRLRAGRAWDFTGHSGQAVPLYREALAGGLAGMRRRRAVIQLASSLRNIGQADEAVRLLIAEQASNDPDAAVLADALSAFLALRLADVGREREAVSVALSALAPHLPRYQRSLASYARALTEPGQTDQG